MARCVMSSMIAQSSPSRSASTVARLSWCGRCCKVMVGLIRVKLRCPHGQASGVAHWVSASGCAAAAATGLHSIDHSLGVVGFGTDEKQGDYWIRRTVGGAPGVTKASSTLPVGRACGAAVSSPAVRTRTHTVTRNITTSNKHNNNKKIP